MREQLTHTQRQYARHEEQKIRLSLVARLLHDCAPKVATRHVIPVIEEALGHFVLKRVELSCRNGCMESP